MYLTPGILPVYLTSKGLISTDTIVNGDFRITGADRRNRNFRVNYDRYGLFVKQVASAEPYAAETLLRESECYRHMAGNPEFLHIANLMPERVYYDPDRRLLVLKLITGGETVQDILDGRAHLPKKVSKAIGKALAAIHSGTGKEFAFEQGSPLLPRRQPWVFSLHLGTLPGMSPANQQLAHELGHQADLFNFLENLRSSWKPDTLIHGDVKWDNIIVSEGKNTSKGLSLKFVDWEMVDFGDPLWDAGSVLHGFVSTWIYGCGQRQPDFRDPRLAKLQKSIKRFWKSYAANREAVAQNRGRSVVRATRYCAARLLQTAFEVQQTGPATRYSIQLVRTACTILRDPEQASEDYLGLQP